MQSQQLHAFSEQWQNTQPRDETSIAKQLSTCFGHCRNKQRVSLGKSISMLTTRIGIFQSRNHHMWNASSQSHNYVELSWNTRSMRKTIETSSNKNAMLHNYNAHWRHWKWLGTAANNRLNTYVAYTYLIETYWKHDTHVANESWIRHGHAKQ